MGVTSLIEDTMFGRVDKVATAIKRIKSFNPLELGQDQPYYVAYSGGKDSDCIRILCDLAGVKHELWHNHTTVDAPETVKYVRSVVPANQINYPKYKGNPANMWDLIVVKGPPTRLMRWCCAIFKEGGGDNRFVVTGVRWAESQNRKKNRGSAEISRDIILNADNDESRRMFENCTLKGQRIINPIIDWTDADVWELLKHYSCQSNPLYQCGYKRIGCIGCPMAGGVMQEIEFARYPKYKENYIYAFQKMVDAHGYAQTSENWHDGESTYKWWISGKAVPKEIENQLEMEGL